MSILDKIKVQKSKVNVRPRAGDRTPDGQRIYTGAVNPIDGRMLSKWDRDIPYNRLKNAYTQAQVTSEQVEAAKYFTQEEGMAFKEVRGLPKVGEEWLDTCMRNKLVYTKENDLKKMVEEHKKEISNPEYQNKQRKNRRALEISKESQSFGRF